MVRKQKNYLTTYEKLARYLDLNYETVRRMLSDDERLMDMAERRLLRAESSRIMFSQSKNSNMEWGEANEKAEKILPKFKDMLEHRPPRGIVDARLLFWTYLVDYYEDAEQMRRAVEGLDTWIKAANVERKFRVSAKTLFRHKRPPRGGSASRFVSVKVGGSRLYLIEQIKLVYLQRLEGYIKKPDKFDILNITDNRFLRKHLASMVVSSVCVSSVLDEKDKLEKENYALKKELAEEKAKNAEAE